MGSTGPTKIMSDLFDSPYSNIMVKDKRISLIDFFIRHGGVFQLPLMSLPDPSTIVSSLIRAGLVRKDIQPSKTRSNVPVDRRWGLNGIFLRIELSLLLIG